MAFGPFLKKEQFYFFFLLQHTFFLCFIGLSHEIQIKHHKVSLRDVMKCETKIHWYNYFFKASQMNALSVNSGRNTDRHYDCMNDHNTFSGQKDPIISYVSPVFKSAGQSDVTVEKSL